MQEVSAAQPSLLQERLQEQEQELLAQEERILAPQILSNTNVNLKIKNNNNNNNALNTETNISQQPFRFQNKYFVNFFFVCQSLL